MGAQEHFAECRIYGGSVHRVVPSRTIKGYISSKTTDGIEPEKKFAESLRYIKKYSPSLYPSDLLRNFSFVKRAIQQTHIF